jgi:carboxypeptidase C (cathepsin A)
VTDESKNGDEKRPVPSPDPAYQVPTGAETSGTWTGGGEQVDYTATAGWTVLRKKEKPSAEIFSVAYVVRDSVVERPVTFIFNGGPGASSAYLHLGLAGPKRVAFPPDGSLPRMPSRLVENGESWLEFTDLVFVDPVGTGFSRIIDRSDQPKKAPEGETFDPKEYFGPKRDLESLCEFIGRWLSAHGRWGSPIFIAGESYGGYRVGRLARMLQESAGVGLNGAILISPALEITPLSPTDYDIGGRIDTLPTFAASAWHHGRSRQFGPETDLSEVLRFAEAFATGEYATYLARGQAMPDADRAAIEGRLADLLGLPAGLVARASGRISIQMFSRELLRDEEKIVGLYDASVTARDPFPDRAELSGPDPTLASAIAAYTMAVNRLVRAEIGVETDREYAVLSFDVNTAWRDDTDQHGLAPPAGATDDLRYGMALNPHLRVLISHGRFDLVTPYFATDRLRDLMRLDPATGDRLTVEHYDGGHMFYAWETSRRAFTAAIRRFVGEALG